MSAMTVAGGDAGKGVVRRPMSRAEAVKLWEDFIDENNEAAGELFMAALLRDARAEYARKARTAAEEEEEQLHAHVFEPWQPSLQPGSALPPPVPAPLVERTVVMGLRAPPHLLLPRNKHGRTGSAALGRSVKPAKKPRAV